MSVLGGIAGSLALNGIGQVFNIEAQELNNELAKQREALARAENFKYGEMQADNAMLRSEDLYNRIQSPKALLKQYKEAGLSPSLMFGGSGAGGQSIPAGAMGSSAAVQPTTYGINPTDSAQIALMTAEAAKAKAEARKNNAEAEAVQPQTEADIARKLSEAGLNNAAKNYTNSQNVLKQIEIEIANTNKPLTIEMFAHQTAKAAYEAQKAFADATTAIVSANVSVQTMEDQIQRYKEENKNLIADTTLKYANKSLTEQQIKESETRIWNIIEQINIDWVNALSNETNANAQKEWLEARIPKIEKELEIEAERLEVEEKRVWVEGVTNMVRTAADVITLRSAFNAKSAGYNPTPKEIKADIKKRGGHALDKKERENRLKKNKNFTNYSY